VSKGIALTVENVERRASLSRLQEAGTGRVYVVAEVVLETVSRDKAPYNFSYFKLADGRGAEFAHAMPTFSGALGYGDLARGGKVRGKVAFEVAEGASGLVLTYEPFGPWGGYEPIRIALD
jgi:hypothetical protein